MNSSIIFRSYLPALLVALIGCKSDSTDSATTSSSQPAPESAVAAVEAPAPKPAGRMQVAAFVRGGQDDAAGKAFAQGMQLAVDSKSPGTPELAVHERAQGLPDSDAFKQLAKAGQTPIVVYWQTSDVVPVAPSLANSKIIGVPVWNVTRAVPRLGQSVYGFGYSTERSFAEFARFAGKNLKSYRFGIISSPAETFAAQTQEFVEETKSQGNTVVFDEKADSASADFTSLVKRATKETCDTIFAALPGDALVALIKAARASGFKGKILVGDSFFASELATLGTDAEGVYILQAWADDAAFKSQYAAKFGGEPDGITLGAAALGYDLVKCIEAAGPNADADAITYSWLSTPCNGLTGKTMFSGERVAQRKKRILTVKGGKLEAVG